MPSRVAAGAMRRMSREPASTREKTSRPFVSVPNGWPQLGGSLGGKWLSKIGSYGATSRAKMAQKTQKAITIAPTMNVGERSRSRMRSERAIRASDRAGHRRRLGVGGRSLACSRSGCGG